MLAIISDIHSNLEALEAVLGDIDKRGIKRIICLGDIVGYGPDPKECLDLVVDRCEVTVCGNHDQAVFYEPYSFNIGAERAAFWARQVFENDPDKTRRDSRWEYLGNLPPEYRGDGFYCVHGSPRRPINEYLFPDDVFTNPGKILENFRKMDKLVCFVGHTHVAGVFLDDPYFDPPDELAEAMKYQLADEKVIINVGSVGQPRDRDWRASYCVFDHQTVEFVRVEYDVEKTAEKIRSIAELDDFLGERLLEGK